MKPPATIAIAGGSIGGLTAACLPRDLADALAKGGSLEAALAAWETAQLALGAALVERTRRIGRRSQVDNNWVPDDPRLLFGLHAPGDQ